VIAFCGKELLLMAVSGAPAWKQALGSAVLAALWVGAEWFVNRLFLAPWRWLRQAGVRSLLSGHELMPLIGAPFTPSAP